MNDGDPVTLPCSLFSANNAFVCGFDHFLALPEVECKRVESVGFGCIKTKGSSTETSLNERENPTLPSFEILEVCKSLQEDESLMKLLGHNSLKSVLLFFWTFYVSRNKQISIYNYFWRIIGHWRLEWWRLLEILQELITEHFEIK